MANVQYIVDKYGDVNHCAAALDIIPLLFSTKSTIQQIIDKPYSTTRVVILQHV